MRELEEKRINKEMAHIRQKFKGESAALGLDLVQTEERADEWCTTSSLEPPEQTEISMDDRRRSE